jgi:hypothetical protein
VGRVRDELAPRVLEPRELDPHALERIRELADLVAAAVDHGLVEAAAGDPVGGALHAPDPPREQARGAEAEEDRDAQGGCSRDEQPPLHLPHARHGVLQRRDEEHRGIRLADRHGHLGVAHPVPRDHACGRAAEPRRPRRKEVVGHIDRHVLGIAANAERRPAPRALHRVDHDPRVHERRVFGRPVLDLLRARGLGMVEREDGEVRRHRRRAARLLVDLRVGQVPLQRRNDHDPGHAERDRDDERERRGEEGADAPERVHSSLNR